MHPVPPSPFKIVRVEHVNPHVSVAIYVKVIVEAADGSEWEFLASTMRTSLKPVTTKKEV